MPAPVLAVVIWCPWLVRLLLIGMYGHSPLPVRPGVPVEVSIEDMGAFTRP